MDKQMTAVEWLIYQIESNHAIGYNQITTQQIQQAKEMERNQIEEFGIECVIKDRKMLRQADCLNKAYLPKPQSIADYFTKTYNNGKDS